MQLAAVRGAPHLDFGARGVPVDEGLRPFQVTVDDPQRVLAVDRDDLERTSTAALAFSEGRLDLDPVGLNQMNLAKPE